MKNFFIQSVSVFVILLSVLFPSFVRAQSDDWGWILDFGISLTIIIERLILIVIGLALIFFLWGLLVFILNAENDDKRSEGKKRMFWGIIALTVMFGVWGIVNLLLYALGIGESSVEIPTFPTELP